MDLRKTLISVLWILLVNLEEDCHAEEGMWGRVCVCVGFNLFLFFLARLCPNWSRQRAALIHGQMSAAEIVWHLRLSCEETQVCCFR